MPDKIAKRSRRIGSKPPEANTAKKRGRPPKPPKTESIPETIQDAPVALLDTSGKTSSSPTTLANPTRTATQNQPYTGLTQVPHGLTFPEFNPNSYFATDLFTNSSSLNETEKEKADELVESIEKKRHTLRIVGANIALNTDVVRTANDFRKLEGTVIDYATTGINNETKFVNYQTAGVNKSIAINRFDQSQERLIQGQKVLAGMQSITPLIDDEWQMRKSLKVSQIKSLEVAAVQAREKLEPALLQLSQSFKEELSEVS